MIKVIANNEYENLKMVVECNSLDETKKIFNEWDDTLDENWDEFTYILEDGSKHGWREIC